MAAARNRRTTGAAHGGRSGRIDALFCAAVGIVASLLLLIADLDPLSADIKYDWLSAWGTLNADAYDDPLTLAGKAGVQVEVLYMVSYSGQPIPAHPRLPGALPLLLPLLLIPYDFLYALWVGTSIALTAFLCLQKANGAQSAGAIAAATAASLVAAPSFVNLRYAGQAALVAVLTVAAWRLSLDRRERLAGLILGIVGALKVFPLVLVFPLLLRRRIQTALSCTVTFVALNVLGVTLLGASLTRALDAFASALDAWFGMLGNGSLYRLSTLHVSKAPWSYIVASSAIAGLFVCAVRTRSIGVPEVWLSLALLGLPISWISYDIVLLPIVLVMLRSTQRAIHLAGVACLGLWLVPPLLYPFAIVDAGYLAASVRLLILVAIMRIKLRSGVLVSGINYDMSVGERRWV